MNTQQVFCGDNIELLKKYPDNHFDSIVTDAPYGLGKEPNAVELMKDWVDKGYHEITGSGFMGKEWDAFVPQPLFWKEAFRVLKHGGHVLSFFGTRTYDWGVMAMRFAGFEVRDTITWHHATGFPKSHNISKKLDKMVGAEREVIGKGISGKTSKGFNLTEEQQKAGTGILAGEYEYTAPSTEAAKKWDGWGSAIKPASEPIVLARKPLEKGLSIAENVLQWGTGGINIDGCRIGFTDNVNVNLTQLNGKDKSNILGKLDYNEGQETRLYNTKGRFPANVIFSHHEDCVCNGTKEIKAIKGGNSGIIGNDIYGKFNGEKNNDGCGFGDANGNKTVENWTCVDGCPIKELDQQSGVTKSQRSARGNVVDNNVFGKYNAQENTVRGHSDKGTASRFFYTAKSSKGERNKGLENTNGHPTIKPIKLMQYLVRLVTPPNGIVLDPFNGSGTTGIAAKLEGLNYVGLELDAEYCKISEARIAAWEVETPETPEIKNDNQLNLF